MANLFSFFGINEMARSAGSLGKIMRGALEQARQFGGEFSVKQFCDWLKQAGAENADPGSVGVRLNKLIADEGEGPTAFKPLITTRGWERGKGTGGTKLLKYAFDGPAGAAAKSDLNKPKAKDDDEIPFEDDDDAATRQKSEGWPKWLPKPIPNGSWDQAKMAQLQDAGYGADKNQLWADIASADDNITVHRLIKAEGVPPQLQNAMLRVAQEVFKNLNKEWDAKSKPLSTTRSFVDDGDDDDSGGVFSDPADEPETELGDDDFEDEEDTNADAAIPTMEPDEEEPEPEATQAGAANFLKPTAPAPASADQPPVKKKSSVSKFFRR